MSWNEVKIGLVPIGSRVYQSKSESGTTADGYPLTIISVKPPEEPHELISVSDLEKWLVALGYKFVCRKINSSRHDLEDISVLIYSDQGWLKKITLNIKIDLNANDRIKIWEGLIKQICESFHLRLIDSRVGLVEPAEFQDLVKKSFAWECFLKRIAAK
jgi:hypothetical protein